jgi:hypothetical protein
VACGVNVYPLFFCSGTKRPHGDGRLLRLDHAFTLVVFDIQSACRSLGLDLIGGLHQLLQKIAMLGQILRFK